MLVLIEVEVGTTKASVVLGRPWVSTSWSLELTIVQEEWLELPWAAFGGGIACCKGGGAGGRLGDGEEGERGEKEKEGAGEECLKSRERWRGKQGQNPCVCHA